MRNQLKVGVIKHKDVHGKELLYLAIEDVLINVGQKTYNKVQKLIDVSRETENEPITDSYIVEDSTKEKPAKVEKYK